MEGKRVSGQLAERLATWNWSGEKTTCNGAKTKRVSCSRDNSIHISEQMIIHCDSLDKCFQNSAEVLSHASNEQ